MVYNITLTNGLALTTIADYTQDNTTSLTLLGRGVANYGQVVANDLVHLLENFSAATAPPNSLTGQLWYNSSTKNLEIYDGSLWHQLITLDELSTLGFLSGNENIVLSGDVTGSGSTNITTTIKAVPGLVAGTYQVVTVNTKGQVTSGTSLATTDLTTAAGSTLTINGAVNATTLVLKSAGGGSIKFADGTIQSTAASAQASAIASLGFTPVQQGTGINQLGNTVKIGWSSAGKVLITIDSTNEGNIALEPWVTSSIATAVATAESVAQTYANTAQTNSETYAASQATAATNNSNAYTVANFVSKGLSSNALYLGWYGPGATLIAQVDATYLGGIALQSWVNAGVNSATLTSRGALVVDGSAQVNGGLNAGNLTINGSQVNDMAQWAITGSYLSFPNGALLQFGSGTIETGSLINVRAYPIAFPNACFAIIGSFGSAVPPSTGNFGIQPANVGQYTVNNTSPAGGADGYFWFAIGY
jgi:hypothetical protein